VVVEFVGPEGRRIGRVKFSRAEFADLKASADELGIDVGELVRRALYHAARKAKEIDPC